MLYRVKLPKQSVRLVKAYTAGMDAEFYTLPGIMGNLRREVVHRFQNSDTEGVLNGHYAWFLNCPRRVLGCELHYSTKGHTGDTAVINIDGFVYNRIVALLGVHS